METGRVTPGTISPEQRTEILARAAAGESLRSIATALGMSKSGVGVICAAEGVSFARTPQTEQATRARVARMAHDRAEKAEELLSHGLTMAYGRFADAATGGTTMDLRNTAVALEKIAMAHQRLVETGSRHAIPPEFGGLPAAGDAGNRSIIRQLGQKLVELAGYNGDGAVNPYSLGNADPEPDADSTPLPDPDPPIESGAEAEPTPLPSPEPVDPLFPDDTDDLGSLLRAVADLDNTEEN